MLECPEAQTAVLSTCICSEQGIARSVAVAGEAAAASQPCRTCCIRSLVVQASSGGLSGTDGWLGLTLAVVTMLATVANFVTLQASRHLGFTATQLQAGAGLIGRVAHVCRA